MNVTRHPIPEGVTAEEAAAALYTILSKAKFGRVKADLIVSRSEYDILEGHTHRHYTRSDGSTAWTKRVTVTGIPTAEIRLTTDEPPEGEQVCR